MSTIFRKSTKEVVYTLIPQQQADGSMNVVIRVGSVNSSSQFEEILSSSVYIPATEVQALRGNPTNDEVGKDPFEVMEERLERLMRSTGRLKL